jgi:hypothetical protein
MKLQFAAARRPCKPSSSGARGDMTAQQLVDRDWPAGWPHR